MLSADNWQSTRLCQLRSFTRSPQSFRRPVRLVLPGVRYCKRQLNQALFGLCVCEAVYHKRQHQTEQHGSQGRQWAPNQSGVTDIAPDTQNRHGNAEQNTNQTNCQSEFVLAHNYYLNGENHNARYAAPGRESLIAQRRRNHQPTGAEWQAAAGGIKLCRVSVRRGRAGADSPSDGTVNPPRSNRKDRRHPSCKHFPEYIPLSDAPCSRSVPMGGRSDQHGRGARPLPRLPRRSWSSCRT